MEKPKELPPKYYLTYFEYLLSFVERYYGEILSESEKDFLLKFNALQENEKCLYVRIYNRRGSFFRLDKLDYAEINPVEKYVPALSSAGFIEVVRKVRTDELEGLFKVFTKDEITSKFQFLTTELGNLKKYKREQLIAVLESILTPDEITKVLLSDNVVLKQGYSNESVMFRFLFFGNLVEDMTSFVVRDIGHLKFEQHKETDFVPHFNTREEAISKLWALLLYEQYRIIRDSSGLSELYEWYILQVKPFKETALEIALPILDKLTLRTASLLEKAKMPEQALKVYQNTFISPSKERQARIFHNLGFTEKAIEVCQFIIKNPQDVKESVFANDFLRKITGAGKKKSATILKQQGEYAQIDIDYINDVERGALAYYKKQGYEGFFAENYIWRGLFGLLFWEEIFDGKLGSIHHPLQTTPSDFFKTSFREERKNQIENKLEKLLDQQALISHISTTCEEKEGIANPMVFWHPLLLENLIEVCKRVEGRGLKKVLWLMAENLKEYTKGFPDLFIWKNDGYVFVEVKSPNDQLSNQQFFWQEFFQAQNINTKVLNVYW